MFERIKNINVFEDKVFAIVGIVLGETPMYQLLIMEKKKEQLSISKSLSTTNFEEVKKSIGKNTPLLFNFSGKGIISKRVASGGNFLKEILFNGSSDQFYIYTLFERENNFVSIGRKEALDEQFELFQKSNYKPVDYSIGPFVGSLAKDIINKEILVLDGNELKFGEDGLVDFTNEGDSNREYKLGEESLKSHEVVLLSTLLNFLYPSDKIENETDFLNTNLKEQKFKKLFDYSAIASLVFFLLALLGSYMLLHYFNNQYVEHEEQLYLFNDNYFQIKKMEEDLQSKQYIVSQSGLLKKNFLAYYINEVGRTVPNQIVLNDLRVNPIGKKIKSKEKIIIEPNVILIEGRSDGSLYVSKWIRELKKNKWVNKIEILNLSSDKKGEDVFALKIHII